jgi:hypothetical protein
MTGPKTGGRSTGLGQPGELEIFTEESSHKFNRLKDWFSGHRVTTLGDRESLGYTITGSLYRAFTDANTQSPWHCVAMEFGTQQLIQVLLALQADNWLHCFAGGKHPLADRVHKLMKDAFSVPVVCQDRVTTTTLDVISKAITALERYGTEVSHGTDPSA